MARLTKANLEAMKRLKELTDARKAASATCTSRRRHTPVQAAIPVSGPPSKMLRAAMKRQEAATYPVVHGDDGITSVPLEGMPHIVARIPTTAYRKLTDDHKRRPSSPALTKRFWFVEGGEVRAMSRRDVPRMDEYSYSVAALMLGAQDGDAIELDDYLTLLPDAMRLVRGGFRAGRNS
jgi:hypothetical protein